MIAERNIKLLYEELLNFRIATSYREISAFYSSSNEIIELSYNENPLGCSKKVLAEIKKISKYVNRYPPIAYNLLRQKLADDLNVSEDEIIIGSGSLDIINSAIRLNSKNHDEIIFSKSSIPMYKWGVISNSSVPVIIPLDLDMNHDFERIINSITNKTKLIIMDNPHNPTGLYIPYKRILEFIKKVPKRILIIIDQAYIEYVQQEQDISVRLIKHFKNLLLTRTFSKIHGLAGLRVGYGISNKDLIRKLNSIRLGNIGITNILGNFAAYSSLNDTHFIQASKEFNKGTKNYLYNIFSKSFIDYKPSETNFLLMRVGNSKKFLEKKPQQIKITPGFAFGYNEWVRMSFDKKIFSTVYSIIKEIKNVEY